MSTKINVTTESPYPERECLSFLDIFTFFWLGSDFVKGRHLCLKTGAGKFMDFTTFKVRVYGPGHDLLDGHMVTLIKEVDIMVKGGG